MNVETIALGLLRSPETNVRIHPEAQVTELARAVAMFGQTRPIIVDEENTILVGNGLFAALKRLDRADAAVLRVAGLTPSAKSKLMMSDNRIFVLGMDDYQGVIELIREVGDYDIPGFDEAALRNLVSDNSMATQTVLGDFGTMSAEELAQRTTGAIPNRSKSEDIVVCPHCNEQFLLGRAKP